MITQEHDDERIFGTLDQPYLTRVRRIGWEISLALSLEGDTGAREDIGIIVLLKDSQIQPTDLLRMAICSTISYRSEARRLKLQAQGRSRY